jgi:hypothetical protein
MKNGAMGTVYRQQERQPGFHNSKSSMVAAIQLKQHPSGGLIPTAKGMLRTSVK